MVPLDIAETYGKKSETFSLNTKNYAEALVLVRKAAVEVDERYEAHRRSQAAKTPIIPAGSIKVKCESRHAVTAIDAVTRNSNCSFEQ